MAGSSRRSRAVDHDVWRKRCEEAHRAEEMIVEPFAQDCNLRNTEHHTASVVVIHHRIVIIGRRCGANGGGGSRDRWCGGDTVLIREATGFTTQRDPARRRLRSVGGAERARSSARCCRTSSSDHKSDVPLR